MLGVGKVCVHQVEGESVCHSLEGACRGPGVFNDSRISWETMYGASNLAELQTNTALGEHRLDYSGNSSCDGGLLRQCPASADPVAAIPAGEPSHIPTRTPELSVGQSSLIASMVLAAKLMTIFPFYGKYGGPQ